MRYGVRGDIEVVGEGAWSGRGVKGEGEGCCVFEGDSGRVESRGGGGGGCEIAVG